MTSIDVRLGAMSAAESPRAESRGSGRPSLLAAPWLAMLRVPLLGKLAGANVLVATVAAVALMIVHRDGADGDVLLGFAVLALAVGVVASVVLIKVALRPVAHLRSTLRRFASGEAGVRIRPSLVADRDLAGIGDAVNDLLDDLLDERARVRQLARDTIRGADDERARIARGLHDSTAQTLAALSLEARIAMQLQDSREVAQHLELIRDLAVDAVEEVRDLSHAIHPRVLDDLGLAAALGWLARGVRHATGLDTSLQCSGDARRIPDDVARSLFRVAEAALVTATEASDIRTIELRLDVTPTHVTLGISDDGRVPRSSTTRVLAQGERLALSAGTLIINDQQERGRRVLALVPLGPRLARPSKELP
jgi:signal transduction histidine kinase